MSKEFVEKIEKMLNENRKEEELGFERMQESYDRIGNKMDESYERMNSSLDESYERMHKSLDKQGKYLKALHYTVIVAYIILIGLMVYTVVIK